MSTNEPTTPGMTLDDLLASSNALDWRLSDPENMLYVDFAATRVVIELAPDFAPEHVANIRRLAREGYWDGLAVTRVNDNYVVQIADPDAEHPERKRGVTSAKEFLPAELDRAIDPALPFTVLEDGDVYAPLVGFTNGFPVARDEQQDRTWLLHTYGAVSAGRDVDIDSGNGAELTIVLGHAPRQLDRNVTVVGRVRQGMEFISSLPRGAGGLGFYGSDHADLKVRSARLASDLPVAQRVPLEVLRTDTALFLKLIETRRNRRDEWFHRPAGRVDIGNVPLPVRAGG